MRFGSVCSGIEAASCAWEPLGFEPAWFAEVEKFPSSVLKHRFPGVTNHGDMNGLATRLVGSDRSVDLLVGGTPCQSFSLLGFREGLSDERGNLALEFARLAAALRPRWVVWENVPGVLSSGEGRDFGSIIGALVELGYGVAWRVLDAQFFGVPQLRRRVFVVGVLGSAPHAGAVLFEQGRSTGHSSSLPKKQPTFPAGPRTCVGRIGALLARGPDSLSIPTVEANHVLVVDGRARLLTTSECERLQGFPVGWTDVPGATDSKRYKALGNSMAVPVMRWIGERIQRVDRILGGER